MRARNCLCTLAVGALAFTVTAYAAPRDAAAGKGQVRSDSSRLLTGDQASLRDAADGSTADGAGLYIRLAPVTGGTPYPAGTNVDNANETLTIPTPPAKAFLEGRLDNYESVEDGTLKTMQVTIDSATYSSGAGAALTNAVTACGSAANCIAAHGQSSSLTLCTAGVCESAWQTTRDAPDLRADYCFPSPHFAACNNVAADRTCGDTTFGANVGSQSECYMATFTLDVPGGAEGTYTIGMVLAGTFIQSGTGNTPLLSKLVPARIVIPTGACCFALGTPAAGCIDDVTQAECNAQPGPRLPSIRVGNPCPPAGDDCAECLNQGPDPLCNDNDACTTETCNNNQCIRGLVAGFDTATECCNPCTGVITDPNDGDPCTLDQCALPPGCSPTQNPPFGYSASRRGDPSNPGNPGGPCDDGSECTLADTCDAAGACVGDPVIGDPCVLDSDCGSPLAKCLANGTCDCSEDVDLTFEKVDPPAGNCYAEGDKITVALHIGGSAKEIIGGQFVIVYEESCLSLNSIAEVAPYTNTIFTQLSPGKIILAVGVELGGDGTAGNADMAILSFDKVGECNECDLCFTDINPEHTYLTDDTGQPVGVNEACSKPIRSLPEVTIDVPGNVKVNVGCNSAVATVTWDVPSASSSCDGNIPLVCTGEHLESGTQWGQDRIQDGGVFPIGNSNFCCTTADSTCNGGLEGCWTVTVNDETSLDVEIQLSPTMDTKPGGGITRCIKFEVFNNCVQAPLVFEEDVVFGGLFDLVGHFNGAVKIPSAVQPACITARDQLHTLRSCYTIGASDCVDGVLNAVFKQDPFFGGNWLIGGNLDGWKKENPNASHDVIDILDFGSMSAEWLNGGYDSDGDLINDGNTPCGRYTSTHADINGDGLVDMLDYTFISMNFLEDSKDCCCPGSSSLGNTVGRTEISVRELFETGQGDLAVADLNADGMVNVADMAALMQGVRPTAKPADRGGKSSGARGSDKR